MILYARGTATIQHGETAEQFQIYDDELEWEPIGGSERSMGQEAIYQAIVDHEELGELRWTVTEYPAGAENFKETDVGKHRIVSDFDYGLEHEPEFDDDYPASLYQRIKQFPDWAKSLTQSAMADHLVNWFQLYYEDPANETPYNGREGGYLYIHGGPYNAEEELRNNFESIVSERAIIEAVSRIEEDGTFDWAPSSQHRNMIDAMEEALAEQFDPEDYGFEDIAAIAAERKPVNVGREHELVTRAELLKQIAALKEALPKQAAHGGIGHNRPPAEFELEVEQQVDVTESLEVIEAELTSDQPDVEAVAKKSSLLHRVMGWIGSKLDTTAEAFCKSFGSTLGKSAVVLPAAILTSPYWGKLAALLVSLKDWLLLALGLS
ncbi:hypothetical protein [Jannaschia aquimarina]|uniref:Uncharacterized protein n=1 Tax=Jannaschia aquimarina TaxID=935700 RepID=A0A0D1D3M6_9RHOB|nr:hypothetical protein [Jannaschia aquimarina]KIT14708.1 hypothetical protein jaqu_35700 [Jannaschia aquimarina]SNT39682.1 hypothetical protein SAMN05421775_1151 [Jannaschia aquimarina]